jgi:acyl-CoA synthetase (AMP-forming)/AMP-acid ligase II
MNPWNRPDYCNVAAALTWQAARQGDAPAIHYPTGLSAGRVQYASCSYYELDTLSDMYARGLHEYGIGRGMRTALMVPPGLSFFALFFALFKAGAVPVLIDPGIGLKPLRECLGEAAPEAFIGVTRAQLARMILRWAPRTIRKTVTDGPRVGLSGINLKQLERLGQRSSGMVQECTLPEEMAAILFTSGSTGIPKGVIYRHRHFAAQVELLQSVFGIESGEVDLPTFPPFALFDPALGMTTVIPWMDPTRPAKADPKILLQAIQDFNVTNIFGSPTLVNNLGRYLGEHNIHLKGVRRVISAGAAVPIDVIRRMQTTLDETARVYTPYGATECLPVCVASSEDLDDEVRQRTLSGEGICVGLPVTGNEVRVIGISDNAIEHPHDITDLPTGVIGEIMVHGPTTTDSYWQREEQTRLSRYTDSHGRTWHRMGDVGYRDAHGRYWYCGRKSQRVDTGNEVLFADQLEAIFNNHPEVARTALVGIGEAGTQTPVLCVETLKRVSQHRQERIQTDLLQLAMRHPMLQTIKTVLFHTHFPVDIRHNAKIGREKLAAWAADELK